MNTRSAGVSARELIRSGLRNLDEAKEQFAQLTALGVGSQGVEMLMEALRRCADPDTALRNLVGIAQHGAVEGKMSTELSELWDNRNAAFALMGVLGASDEMGKLMRTRPSLVRAAALDECGSARWSRERRVNHMLKAVNAQDHDGAPVSAMPQPQAVSALRRTYHHQLAAIMSMDVTAADPLEIQPVVSRALSDLADATLEGALAIAKAAVEGSERCRFAIIAMGKLGAQELNYVSDVDLIYVVEPAQANNAPDVAELTRVGTRIASMLPRICGSAMPGVQEPALWPIDTALRPEGKDGPLVRRLASHEGYYAKWAKNWEFQALLKARAAAGDEALGDAYISMVQPLVWRASTRDNFVNDCQKMRTRVEEHIAPELRGREIKLGKGGLRDVEFTVQMLQLVHGRYDETLRRRSTLDALTALTQGGYVSRGQSQRMSQDYRFERVLEHRQQMWQLRRTHLFPDCGMAELGGAASGRVSDAALNDNPELSRLSRAFGLLGDELVNRYDSVRREVRRLHADIYYRPMLPISAQLSEDQVTLDERATRDRFQSIGFADPDQAMRHVAALTSGVSRAAKINRILLPAVLKWLSEGQNPDMGLLAWRRLEEQFGDNSGYLGFLRDSTQAAQRLCHVLSNSRLLGEALRRSVESVTWLGDDSKLQARSRASLDAQCSATARRYSSPERITEFATSLRAMRRHEIERIGLAWMSGVMDQGTCLQSMTDVVDAAIEAALQWSVLVQTHAFELDRAPAAIAVIAMGRYGGREVNFCSDADAILVYRPCLDAADSAEAARFAQAVAEQLRQVLLGPVSAEPGIDLDLGLRPEGKNGPVIRSYDSCETYYTRWFSTWERQALLRARPAAGDHALAEDFLANLADPLRYPSQPLGEEQVGEIRMLKSRMEAERLPRGVSREQHLKLGAGGLSDVEWTVQLLQLQHAGANSMLRTTSTMDALSALEQEGVVSAEDAAVLRQAWWMCTGARNGNYLWSGRVGQADVLPSDSESLGGVAVFLGYDANQGQYFNNDVKSVMRRCRDVVQRLFYEA